MNIGDLPRMNAGRTPGKVALTDARGTTTYADLDARSNALANALLALGVEPRTNVAVLLTNRAAGLDPAPPSHDEVEAMGRQLAGKLSLPLEKMLTRWLGG